MNQAARPFVHQEALAFPVVFGNAQQNCGQFQFQGVLHLRDVQVAVPGDAEIPLSPDEIPFSAVFHRGRINGKTFPAGINPACFGKFPFHGIRIRIHKCVGPVVKSSGRIRLIPGRREIDDPFSVRIVDFRCPDIAAHIPGRMPDPHRLLRRIPQSVQRVCGAQDHPVKCRHRSREIIPAVPVCNKRIRSLFNKCFHLPLPFRLHLPGKRGCRRLTAAPEILSV